MKKLVVAGGGVLGSQIAFQAAFKGLEVVFWLRHDDSIGRTKPKVDNLYKIYLGELEALKPLLGKKDASYPRGLIDDFAGLDEAKIEQLKENVKRAYESVTYTTNLAEAVENADFVIESVAEIPDVKIDFYSKMADLLPEKTIIATNSSTLLPSSFAQYTGRPEKYLSMHFANHIWRNNLAEVMGHSETGKEAFEAIVNLSHEIGMIPLRVNKEQPGYLLNSLLVPLLSSAQALLANEVSDYETIDLAWKLGTGAPYGPFQILDVVGLETAYNIASMRAAQEKDENGIQHRIVAMLKKYIEAGKTGVNAGEGFYKYK